ncbi:hypothetical protein ACFOKF_13310 [Sphingobium rhizovicinum]|uniref:DUF202 domain-containing protein n=1 Tax=Sphingobium rhizovicinum TaxID=432308 RepID=A0ABV7NI88_9SPHN
MTFRQTMIAIAIRTAGAVMIVIACLLGRAQHDIKSHSLPDVPGVAEWLITIGSVTGLCIGALILLSGARLFTRH